MCLYYVKKNLFYSLSTSLRVAHFSAFIFLMVILCHILIFGTSYGMSVGNPLDVAYYFNLLISMFLFYRIL